jgi:hypothetical protein
MSGERTHPAHDHSQAATEPLRTHQLVLDILGGYHPATSTVYIQGAGRELRNCTAQLDNNGDLIITPLP